MGVNTNRDAWAFNFNGTHLADNIERTVAAYNRERMRWHESRRTADLDKFLTDDSSQIKWSSSLKALLEANVVGEFARTDVRVADYRPFTREHLYFNRLLTHRRARLPRVFPSANEDGQNTTICVPGPGNRQDFGAFATKFIPALDFAFEKAQVFPFYTYDEDGSNRRENITDWALEEFRKHYNDPSIAKWDVFHYTYALLHSPEYRERYAANLKRELPRIPYAPDFRAFATAGKKLAELHINYEQQPEYPLERIETPNAKLGYRVEKMRLGRDKSSLFYNEFLTLVGIPQRPTNTASATARRWNG
jgi:predicted helicase